MNLKSLGNRADLGFPGLFGEVRDHGDHLSILSTVCPGFYWGNYLLYDRPPEPGELETWRKQFASEIGCHPEIEHEAFGWDSSHGEMGDIESFLDAGFKTDICSVLVADSLSKPSHYSSEAITRPLETEDEWVASAWCGSSYGDKPAQHLNKRVEAFTESWRGVMERGEGIQYGAFVNGELAGVVGVYRFEDAGVVDGVVVHTDHRKQGIGRSMVYDAAAHALTELDVRETMLLAEEGSAAERMYTQLGFAVVEKQVGILRTS